MRCCVGVAEMMMGGRGINSDGGGTKMKFFLITIRYQPFHYLQCIRVVHNEMTDKDEMRLLLIVNFSFVSYEMKFLESS